MKDLSPSPWEGEPKPLGSRVGQRWAVTFVFQRLSPGLVHSGSGSGVSPGTRGGRGEP